MNTLYDLVSRVLDSRDGFGDMTNERRALRAAIWGAEQVSAKHEWGDYITEATAALQAPVEINASVSSAGVVTLGSGTLPAWAALASLKIDDTLHTVKTRDSDSQATLENYAGSGVTLTRLTLVNDRLLINDEVKSIFYVRNESQDLGLLFFSVQSFFQHRISSSGVTGDPCVVSAISVQYRHGRRTELRFSPAPATPTEIRLSYRRRPRKAVLVHDCESVSINMSTATIQKPVLLTDLTGLVLMLSGNSQRPDADIGFSLVDDNPPAESLEVIALASPTSLTLSSSHEDTEERGGVLTQYLDIPSYTSEAAAMYAEAKYLQIGNGSIGDFWQAVRIADAELRQAMEQESVLSKHASMPLRNSTYISPDIIPID